MQYALDVVAQWQLKLAVRMRKTERRLQDQHEPLATSGIYKVQFARLANRVLLCVHTHMMFAVQSRSAVVLDLTLKPKLPSARHAHALPKHEWLWDAAAVICAKRTEKDLIV